jgi:mono-ADP-ribosyltransferase sirtuin 6
MEELRKKSLDEQTLTIAQWIVNSKHLVAFTGAGISTASGIPDFRGPDGVWTRKDKGLPPPKMKKPWSQIAPNSGHYFLAELQELGILKFLITQNTDNLHLESGILKENIAELHGNGQYVVCLNCRTKYTYEQAKWDRGKWGPGYRTRPIQKGQPICPSCSGRLISSVVNFGDPMPEDEMNLSKDHSEQADVYLIIGSSLVVTPAADLPVIAMNNNAKTILINKGETPLDAIVTIKIEEDITLVLEQIKTHIKKLLRK